MVVSPVLLYLAARLTTMSLDVIREMFGNENFSIKMCEIHHGLLEFFELVNLCLSNNNISNSSTYYQIVVADYWKLIIGTSGNKHCLGINTKTFS